MLNFKSLCILKQKLTRVFWTWDLQPPLLWFVRDGHEQKLAQWKNERELLERWQRLDHPRQPDNSTTAATELPIEEANETGKPVPAPEVTSPEVKDCHIK